MVDGERQIGRVSGDARGDIFEVPLSAVNRHHAPVAPLAHITWQSFWVRNASFQYDGAAPQAQQCHTYLYKKHMCSLRKACRWKADNTVTSLNKTHVMHIQINPLSKVSRCHFKIQLGTGTS